MKKLNNIKKGITHSGSFHLDDVMSTAFLKFIIPNIEIIRLNEFIGDGSDDEIVFDIGLGEFDHHQEVVKHDEFGNKYCAFALLWDSYYKDFLKLFDITNIEEVSEYMKNNFISKINQGDNNGYKNVKYFYENLIIIKHNKLWFENNIDEYTNKQFDKAVKQASLILKTWVRNAINETYKHTNKIDTREDIWGTLFQ